LAVSMLGAAGGGGGGGGGVGAGFTGTRGVGAGGAVGGGGGFVDFMAVSGAAFDSWLHAAASVARTTRGGVDFIFGLLRERGSPGAREPPPVRLAGFGSVGRAPRGFHP